MINRRTAREWMTNKWRGEMMTETYVGSQDSAEMGTPNEMKGIRHQMNHLNSIRTSSPGEFN